MNQRRSPELRRALGAAPFSRHPLWELRPPDLSQKWTENLGVGWGEEEWRLGGGRGPPQDASWQLGGREPDAANPTPSPSSGHGWGRHWPRARRPRLRASPHRWGPEETTREREAEESWGGTRWLTWEVIMMLESIRKLMAKYKEGSYLHFPLPKATARSDHGPPHTGSCRPRATARTSARQPDAIKLRPSQPISSYVQRFPPRARSGRVLSSWGPGEGPGRGRPGGGP